MSTFEIISLIGLFILIVMPIYFYLTGKTDQKEMQRNDYEIRRQNKKDIVCDEYMKLALSSKDNGISALFKVGISELENESEAIAVVDNINKRTSKSALGKSNEAIREFGILLFFQSTSWREINDKGGVLNTIEYLKNKKKSE